MLQVKIEDTGKTGNRSETLTIETKLMTFWLIQTFHAFYKMKTN